MEKKKDGKERGGRKDQLEKEGRKAERRRKDVSVQNAGWEGGIEKKKIQLLLIILRNTLGNI